MQIANELHRIAKDQPRTRRGKHADAQLRELAAVAEAQSMEASDGRKAVRAYGQRIEALEAQLAEALNRIKALEEKCQDHTLAFEELASAANQ